MRHSIIYSDINGDTYVSYTFDGEPVVHAELLGASAELGRKYQFAIKELELTQEYLGEVLVILKPYIDLFFANEGAKPVKMTRRDEVIVQGLFSASTASYGKLFMGVGQGRKQFQPRDFFSKDGKKFEELHAWWMDFRNKYIAHSVGTLYDDARIVLLLAPPYADELDWFWCIPHVRFHRLPEIDSIEDLSKMIEFMLTIVRGKQNRLLQHIANNLSHKERQTYRMSAVYASICEQPELSPIIPE